jgi:hypothetical protein
MVLHDLDSNGFTVNDDAIAVLLTNGNPARLTPPPTCSRCALG